MGGEEGRENIIRIYCMRKIMLSIKGKIKIISFTRPLSKSSHKPQILVRRDVVNSESQACNTGSCG